MKNNNRRIIIGSVAALMILTALPAGTAGARSSWRCFRHKTGEKVFASKMNLARQAAGQPSLILDKQLSKVARKHTREMTAKSRLFHTSSSTLSNRVTRWTVLGENVGVGSTVVSLHAAFMDSPAHRSNVLYGTFRHVGIGTREANGRLWVTVVFEASTDPGTRLAPPTCSS